MCTICIRVKITPGCKFAPPYVHMPINCVNTYLGLIRNLTLGTHFRRNLLCLNVLNDSSSVFSRCMCVGGRGGDSSIFRWRSMSLKLLHSIHIIAMSEKHIHNMKTIFYSYDCIVINDFQPSIPTPHTGCKLISHLIGNKGMAAMMVALYPSNSPGHT